MNSSLDRLLLAVVCCAAALPGALAERLQGDPEAVVAVERMIERFGGADLWSRARTLYLEYDGWRSEPAEPVIERAWRDLREPYQRAEFEGRSFYTIFAMTPERSWLSRDGQVRVFEPDRHRAMVGWHPYDFYTALRSLAVGDPSLRLQWDAPDRVVITTTDGVERGWWRIDQNGGLIQWGAISDDGEPLEYLYGPMRAFGNVNFPAWGSSQDGGWRWNYTIVDLSTDPIPLTVGLDPPGD